MPLPSTCNISQIDFFYAMAFLHYRKTLMKPNKFPNAILDGVGIQLHEVAIIIMGACSQCKVQNIVNIVHIELEQGANLFINNVFLDQLKMLMFHNLQATNLTLVGKKMDV